ncbi:hypothetical protein T4E_9366 [Trichinella pseudospiralis]|uniref:Uncharacterized protein n=1 Tax=Trichinella pseudospiralis TaxID=6337 RepID=A0A0V0XTQ9_TRIPS|nr:hypothetical protein T4E_9366 [Trichinella pseudospiralis]
MGNVQDVQPPELPNHRPDLQISVPFRTAKTAGSHANLGYGWHFQGCTTMVSTAVYHP